MHHTLLWAQFRFSVEPFLVVRCTTVAYRHSRLRYKVVNEDGSSSKHQQKCKAKSEGNELDVAANSHLILLMYSYAGHLN